MSILVILSMSVLPGRLDDARAILADQLPATRAYDGFEALTTHVDQDDPAQVVLVERWESREKYVAYIAWRRSVGDPRIAEVLSAPYAVRFFDDLDV